MKVIHVFLLLLLLFFFFFFLVLPVYCYQPVTLHPHACMLSHVTPWTAASQAPLSMDFSRQKYWSGLPFPSPTCLFLKQTNIDFRLHAQRVPVLCVLLDLARGHVPIHLPKWPPASWPQLQMEVACNYYQSDSTWNSTKVWKTQSSGDWKKDDMNFKFLKI